MKQATANLVQVTPEQIQELKAQHGSIYKIKVETGETCYVRRPTIKEIEYASSLLNQGKYITYNITLFKTCFLAGDNILEDEVKLTAASGQMMETIETLTAEVEKL
jgi:hypothetical protein